MTPSVSCDLLFRHYVANPWVDNTYCTGPSMRSQQEKKQNLTILKRTRCVQFRRQKLSSRAFLQSLSVERLGFCQLATSLQELLTETNVFGCSSPSLARPWHGATSTPWHKPSHKQFPTIAPWQNLRTNSSRAVEAEARDAEAAGSATGPSDRPLLGGSWVLLTPLITVLISPPSPLSRLQVDS